MSASDDFLLRFWGVRGTVPCPGPRTLRYGGNTSCVEILCGGQRLVFDAGTGLRQLGRAMLANGDPLDMHLFFSHTHMDHVNGLPFFRPAYDERNRFTFWGGNLKALGWQLEQVLGTFMQTPLFPVPLGIMHACIAFNDFVPGDVIRPAPGIQVRTTGLNHPGGAVGYRIEFAGRIACYVTDTEHVPGTLDQGILALIQDADLVIYDTTYTDDEFTRFRGWGHSTWEEGIRLCEAAGARRLVAFHHDPDHDDDLLDAMACQIERRRPGSLVAHEGLILTL